MERQKQISNTGLTATWNLSTSNNIKTRLSKKHWTIKRRNFTPKVAWRIKGNVHLSTKPKENVTYVSMKRSRILVRRRQFVEQSSELINKFWTLFNKLPPCTSVDIKSVDIKTSSPFCSMIARTKSCIFTGIFLAVFPSTQSFLSARLMFWLLRFPKQKLNSSMQQFHWRKWRVIFSVNWCHGIDVTLLFVYYYFAISMLYFNVNWLKIAIRDETLL